MLYERVSCGDDDIMEKQFDEQLRKLFQTEAERSGQTGRVSMKNHPLKLARQRDMEYRF